MGAGTSGKWGVCMKFGGLVCGTFVLINSRVQACRAQECKLLSAFDTRPFGCLSGCMCVCSQQVEKTFVNSWSVAPNSPHFVSVHTDWTFLVTSCPGLSVKSPGDPTLDRLLALLLPLNRCCLLLTYALTVLSRYLLTYLASTQYQSQKDGLLFHLHMPLQHERCFTFLWKLLWIFHSKAEGRFWPQQPVLMPWKPLNRPAVLM